MKTLLNITASISFSLALTFFEQPAVACSRILLNTDNVHIVGRTMDLYMPDHANLVVYPRGIKSHWTEARLSHQNTQRRLRTHEKGLPGAKFIDTGKARR